MVRQIALSKLGQRAFAGAKAFLIWLFRSTLQFLDVGAKAAGSLSVLVGVLYGAFEYNRNKADQQVEKTFAYLKKFDEVSYIASRDKIEAALTKNYAKIAAAVSNEKTLANTINGVISQENISGDIDRVVYFYDELVYCIISNYCQAQLAHDLFLPRAQQYYQNLYSYIVTMRANPATAHYASGLETLVISPN